MTANSHKLKIDWPAFGDARKAISSFPSITRNRSSF